MYSHLFVCLFGMGTVFFGLICLVFLCGLLSRVLRDQPNSIAPRVTRKIQPEEIAVISAALAQELQADPEQIRLLSISIKE